MLISMASIQVDRLLKRQVRDNQFALFQKPSGLIFVAPLLASLPQHPWDLPRGANRLGTCLSGGFLVLDEGTWYSKKQLGLSYSATSLACVWFVPIWAELQ